MADTNLETRLRESSEAVDAALTRLSEAMSARGDAVRDALEAGGDPKEIANATGLTVGQVWNAGRGDPISPPPLDVRARTAS